MFMIYDIVIGTILLAFAVRGHKRGLILTLCSLVAVFTAFIGASFVADLLTPKVADIMVPKISSIIERRLEEESDPSAPEAKTPDAEETEVGASYAANAGILDKAIETLHLPEGILDSVKDSLQQLQDISELPGILTEAVARSAAETVLYLIIFLISFLLILLLWSIIAHTLDLVAHLPVLHFFNKTGGFVLGLIKGVFFLFVVAWVLRYLGGIIPDAAIEHTYLLRFFMTTDPLALLLGG